MGTLGNQPERNRRVVDNDDLDNFLSFALDMSQKHCIPVETVVMARQTLELERQNDIAVDAGDKEDENLAGFGDIFNDIAGSIQAAALAD